MIWPPPRGMDVQLHPVVCCCNAKWMLNRRWSWHMRKLFLIWNAETCEQEHRAPVYPILILYIMLVKGVPWKLRVFPWHIILMTSLTYEYWLSSCVVLGWALSIIDRSSRVIFTWNNSMHDNKVLNKLSTCWTNGDWQCCLSLNVMSSIPPYHYSNVIISAMASQITGVSIIYWSFVKGIHRSPADSPHKDQWRGALLLSLIWVLTNAWANNRDAGDLRRHRAHYDVTVVYDFTSVLWQQHKEQRTVNVSYTPYYRRQWLTRVPLIIGCPFVDRANT